MDYEMDDDLDNEDLELDDNTRSSSGEENSRRANEIADKKIRATKNRVKDPKKKIDLSDRSKEAALEKLTSRNSSVS